VQQQGEAQRMMEAALSVEHQQHQAHGHHHGGDEVARLARDLGVGILPMHERGRDERTAAQAREEEVEGDGHAPDGFELHIHHLT
jgi:hypothetical protein